MIQPTDPIKLPAPPNDIHSVELRRRAGELFLEFAEPTLRDPKLSLSNRVKVLSALRMYACAGSWTTDQTEAESPA